MEKVVKFVKGTGKVVLALLTGIFMPVLIWVALGAAVIQRQREKRLRKEVAPVIDNILADAGVTVHK